MTDPNRDEAASLSGGRLFRVADANALVPLVKEAFGRARPLRARCVELVGRLADAGFPCDLEDLVVDPAAPADVRGMQAKLREVADGLRAVLHELTNFGIEVKSGDGLCDFRSRRRGRIVYLCWRWGEDEIRHWHDLDAGVAGRRPIDDADAFEGDLLQ